MKKFLCLIFIIFCLVSVAEAASNTENEQCAGAIGSGLFLFLIYLAFVKKNEKEKEPEINTTQPALLDKISISPTHTLTPEPDKNISHSQTQPEKVRQAIENISHGYNTEYIIPSRSLLDNLADTYGYTQASQDYKNVRSKIKEMIRKNLAANCDIWDKKTKQAALNLIIDAFNGRIEPILAKATTDNFGILKQKIIDVFYIVNRYGDYLHNLHIEIGYLNLCLEELRLACVMNEIRKRDMEEQRRIKEQIREEEKARREIEKAIKTAQQEEAILQKAMDKIRAEMEKANAEQQAAYEMQIAELEKKYHEAEERNKRAESMAQQTKLGYVYIISNEGSFGHDVYKIGMTRRLDPLDRVRELSNASVPFPFEVHAMIWSDDAPALENMLHKKFALYQVNKVNFRKEFFKLPLSDIRAELERNNLNVKWTITAETTEYLESLAIEKAIQDDTQAREAWLNHQLDNIPKTDIFTDDKETELL